MIGEDKCTFNTLYFVCLFNKQICNIKNYNKYTASIMWKLKQIYFVIYKMFDWIYNFLPFSASVNVSNDTSDCESLNQVWE